MKRKAGEKKYLRVIGVSIFWLVVWQTAAMIVNNPLFLPGPIEIVTTLAGLAMTGNFYLSVIWTMGRCFVAIILSLGLGGLFAYLGYRHRLVRDVVSLPIAFFKAVPVMAVVIYIILLVESNWVGVVVCTLMCLPIAYTNILEGLFAVDEKLVEVSRIYGLSESDFFRLVQFPSVLPYLKAALSLIAGISWKAVVAAEVLSIPRYSLGSEMLNAKYYLETPKLFAYIAVIVALSILLEKTIKKFVSGLDWKPYENSRMISRHIQSESHLKGKLYRAKDQIPPSITIAEGNKSYGKNKVLDNVNLTINSGERVALLGPSGCGKTTLARTICGLEELDSGKVTVKPQTNCAYLFQEDRLLPWLNVYDNIALGLYEKKEEQAENPDTVIRNLAQQLELEKDIWKLPCELSGGMQHRVALGRTFAAEKKLIILDEPFRGLDEDLKERLIKRLWNEQVAGRTLLLITHDKEDAKNLAERVIEFNFWK